MHDDNPHVRRWQKEIMKEYGSIESYRKTLYGTWEENRERKKELCGEEISVIAIDELADLVTECERLQDDLYMRLREAFGCLDWEIDDAF